MFYQSLRPSGFVRETKHYYSRKHGFYGLKSEVSSLPTGIAIGCNVGCPGSVADITVFKVNEEWHEMAMEKRGAAEVSFEDSGQLHDKFNDHWSELCDTRYIGLQNEILVICPKTKPINGWSTADDKLRHHRITHDRVIVENVFGRLCLYVLFSQNWRQSNETYGHCLETVLALTNYHITLNSLRADDVTVCNAVRNRQFSIGVGICTKCAATQSKKLDLDFGNNYDVAGVLHANSTEEVAKIVIYFLRF